MFQQNYMIVDEDDHEAIFAVFELACDALACLKFVYLKGYVIIASSDCDQEIMDAVLGKSEQGNFFVAKRQGATRYWTTV